MQIITHVVDYEIIIEIFINENRIEIKIYSYIINVSHCNDCHNIFK